MWSGRFAPNRHDGRAPSELPPFAERAERSLDEVFDRVQGRVLRAQADFASEKREARCLLPRLLGQPLERQLILAANSRRYQTWGVCELLLDEAWRSRFKEPRRTEALCRVAVTASAGLPVDRYGRALACDFQARCWIGLANGRRILADFRGAQTALVEAQKLLASGTGNPLEKAGWLDIRASLLAAQNKYREAEECVGRAIRIYFQFGEKHALGSALIKRGMICEAIEQTGRAIVLSRFGLELVEPERDASLVLGGWLNLIHCLRTAGRDRDALAALTQARSLYLQSDDRTTVLRFQWLEGSIAVSLGRDEQAEGCLREARDGFIQLGVALAAGEVSLELAGLLCRQGRTAEVRALATETIALFESLEIQREALAAFILLRQAAERDRVTEALLRRLGNSLREPRARG
jgi:tetratricopeptide (TPR) repeat protein